MRLKNSNRMKVNYGNCELQCAINQGQLCGCLLLVRQMLILQEPAVLVTVILLQLFFLTRLTCSACYKAKMLTSK